MDIKEDNMKRTIRIGGSISGVIATGSFQNLRPTFTWEETYEEDIQPNKIDFNDANVEKRIKQLYEKSFNMLKEAEQKAIIERIQREREDLRFMISPEGNILPSVTSIIGYDADFFTVPQDLTQYASQGNIIDKRVKHYITTGKWLQGKELKDCWTDIVILTRGGLRLSVDTGDFPAFLERYAVKDMKVGERFFFDLEGYTGEPDFFGKPEFKEALPILTVFDVKRTPNKISNGLQLSAYAKKFDIKQGIIISINDKTAQGYSKPIIYDEDALNGYFKMFKQKQEKFKQRYNI
jgi:hypothetical protein